MEFWQQLKEDFNFKFLNNKNFQRVAWGILVFMVLAALVTVDFNQVNLEEGEVSTRDIEAPKTVKFVDEEATEKAKQKAADAVSKVYEEKVTVVSNTKQKINDFFALVEKMRKQAVDSDQQENQKNEQQEAIQSKELKEDSLQEKIEKLQKQTELKLTPQEIEYLLTISSEKVGHLQEDVLNILIKYLNRGIKSDDLENVKQQMAAEVSQLQREQEYSGLVQKLTQQWVQPNLIYKSELTEEKRAEARRNVEPRMQTIRKGEIIIRHGKVVTEEDIHKLEVLGLREPKINYLNIIGYLLVVLIIVAVTVIYIFQYHYYVLEDMGELALLGLLPIIILSLAKIVQYLPIAYPSFVVPVAAAAILIAVLIDINLAIVVTAAISFLVALVSDESIIDMGVAVVSSLAGIYSVNKLSQRGDLVRAGFIVGGASSLTIFSFMLTGPTAVDWMSVLRIVPLGLINGVIVAVVTNGLLPYVENIFGITSPVKLLELSNPNHPLLKRVLVEAPGTYHHSIIVGNLAEAAADEVGADSLLARVGAYYHDIGKIKRSYFFNENQIGAENPHDKLSPSLSTLIITSHVKDGVEMGQEYKLPEVVIDIIKQHHGTSLVSFFYQEAVYDDKYKTVDEEEFRYDGPKPTTKEAALVMLADMVEAAVRSNVSVQSDPDKLEKFVRDLVKKKLNDGQLDRSELTLNEINKIITSFVNILKGIFHNRIEYPDNIAQQFKEGAEKDENSD